MKFSVIVPVYNTEKYLERCLDSLVRQIHKDFEVICIDDKSTDQSFAILEKYGKKHPSLFKIIQHEINKGLAASRNTGIREAKGDYIAFLDSDDFVSSEWLGVANLIIKSHSPDIIGFSITAFDQVHDLDDSGNLLNVREPYYFNNFNEYYLQGFIDDEKRIKNLIFLMQQYSVVRIYKKNLFKENHIEFPEVFRTFEDVATIPRVSFYAKSFYIASCYAPYFYRKNVVTSLSYENDYLLKNHETIYGVIDYLYDFLDKKNALSIFKKEFDLFRNDYMFWFTASRIYDLPSKDEKRLATQKILLNAYKKHPLFIEDLDFTKIPPFHREAKKKLLLILKKASLLPDIKAQKFLSKKLTSHSLYFERYKKAIFHFFSKCLRKLKRIFLSHFK